MVRNVGGWETTFSSRLEASDQSICLSPGKSFLASRAHQRISVSVPASIVQHLWPDTTLYAFFSIAIHVEFKSAAVVLHPGWLHPGWLHSGWLHSGWLHSGWLHSGWLHSGWHCAGGLYSSWLPPDWPHSGLLHSDRDQKGLLPVIYNRVNPT